jgi:hypothetical protein
VERYAAEFLDVLDVDDGLRRSDVVLHQADEVGAAREYLGVVPIRPEQT